MGEEESIIAFKASIVRVLGTVWNSTNVIAQLEGSSALFTALITVPNTSKDLALSINCKLERSRTLGAQSVVAVLLAPNYGLYTLSCNELIPRGALFALEAGIRHAALFSQSKTFLALNTFVVDCFSTAVEIAFSILELES